MRSIVSRLFGRFNRLVFRGAPRIWGWRDYAGGGWKCLAALGETQGSCQSWPYGGLLIEGEQGRHKACPYRTVGGFWRRRRGRRGRAGTRPAPTGPLGDFGDDDGGGGGGQAQGLPLQDRWGRWRRLWGRRGRAGTRPAPTGPLGDFGDDGGGGGGQAQGLPLQDRLGDFGDDYGGSAQKQTQGENLHS